MKLYLKNIIKILLVLVAFNVAAETNDAQKILALSDAVRNPDYSFGVTMTLTEYQNGKQAGVSTLMVYSKTDQQGGQFRSLIRFLAPARDANKLMLKVGNDLWFYDSTSKASIRISPQQRLLGQAANGDVLTINLAKDYRASLSGEEEIEDGDRQKRHCYKLILEASNADVTYDHMEAWIDVINNRLVKAKFYSESNRLLKTAYYRRYEDQLGARRPTETVIIDGLDAKSVTVLRFTDWAKRDVPESWLQRDYLPRFRPE